MCTPAVTSVTHSLGTEGRYGHCSGILSEVKVTTIEKNVQEDVHDKGKFSRKVEE